MNNSNTTRIITTVIIILLWISMAMNIEIAGPTLIDLKLRLNSSYEKVSLSVSGRGFGNILGAIIGGFLTDKLGSFKELIVATTQAGLGLFVYFLPLVKRTSFLWCMFFSVGAMYGINNVAGQRIILDLWEQRAAGALHMVHTGYGIGAVLVALISNQFLAKGFYNTTTSSVYDTNVTERSAPITTEHYVVTKTSEIQYAYLCVAGFDFILIVPFIVLQVLKCRSEHAVRHTEQAKKRSVKEMLNPATYANGSLCFGTIMFTLLFLYFFSLMASGKMFGNFVRSFSVDALRFSKDLASYLNMAYWGSYTFGRIVGSINSRYFPISKLFFGEVLLNLIAVTLIDFLATKSATAFWVTVIILGFSFGPAMPSCIAYGNTQIEVTGICLMLITISAGLGESLCIWIGGSVYDSYGPGAVLYIVQGGGIALFVVTTLMILASCLRSKKNHENYFNHIQDKTESDPLIQEENN